MRRRGKDEDDDSFSKFEDVIKDIFAKIEKQTSEFFDKFEFDATKVLEDILSDAYSTLEKGYKKFLDNFTKKIREAFDTLKDYILKTFQAVFSKIQGGLSNTLNNISKAFQTVFSKIQSGLLNTLNKFSGFFKATITGITSTLSTSFNTLQSFFSKIPSLGKAITSTLSNSKTLLDNIKNITKNTITLFASLRDSFGNIFSNLSNITKNVYAGISNVFSIVKRNLNNILSFVGNIIKSVQNVFKAGLIGFGLITAGLFTLSIKKAVEAYKDADKAAESLRQETGLTSRMLSREIYASLGKISVRLSENAKYISEAFSVFGTSLNSLFNQDNLVFIGQMADRLGISAKSSSTVLKQFILIGRYSQESAQGISKMAVAMAENAKVAPAAVFEELANSSEQVYNFIGANPKQLVKTAVYAKKIGFEMNKIAEITRQILNLEDSITSEMEASVLLGKRISFDRARTLALNNDLVGSFNEILTQVGGIDQFNKMSFVQREAIAKAVGIESSKLGELLAMQEELAKAKDLDLNKQKELNNALMEGNFEKAKGVLKSNQMIGREEALERKRLALQRKLGQQLSNLLQKLQPFTDKIYEGLMKLIPEVGKFFDKLKIEERITKFFNSIDIEKLVEGGKVFFSILGKIYDTLGMTGILATTIGLKLSGMGVSLAKSLLNAGPTIKNFFSSISGAIGNIRNRISDTTNTVTSSLSSNPAQPKTKTKSTTSNIQSPVQSSIQKNVQGSDTFKTFSDNIFNILNKLKTFVFDVFKSIGSTIQSFLTSAGQGISSFVSSISSGLAGALRVLGPALSMFLSQFANPMVLIGLGAVTLSVIGFASALRIAEPVINKFMDTVSNLFVVVKDIVVTTIGTIKDVFSLIIGKINISGSEVTNSLGKFIEPFLAIPAAFGRILGSVSKIFEGVSKIVENVSSTIQNITSKAFGFVENVFSGVFGLFERITSGITGLGSKLLDFIGFPSNKDIQNKFDNTASNITEYSKTFSEKVSAGIAEKFSKKEIDLEKAAGLSPQKVEDLKKNLLNLASFFDENATLFEKTMPTFYNASMALSLLSESIDFNESKFKGIDSLKKIAGELPPILEMLAQQKEKISSVNEVLKTFTEALSFEESKFSGIKGFKELNKSSEEIIRFLTFVNDNYTTFFMAGNALKAFSEGLKDNPFEKLKFENATGLEKIGDFYTKINIYGEEGTKNFITFFNSLNKIEFNESKWSSITKTFYTLVETFKALNTQIDKFNEKKFNSIMSGPNKELIQSTMIQTTSAEKLKDLKQKTSEEKNSIMKVYLVLEKIYEELVSGQITVSMDGRKVGRIVMEGATGQ